MRKLILEKDKLKESKVETTRGTHEASFFPLIQSLYLMIMINCPDFLGWVLKTIHTAASHATYRAVSCQNEYLLPKHRLPEAQWRGRWMKASFFLWEVHGHRGWRVEGLCGPDQMWKQQPGFPLKPGCFDPQQSTPVVKWGTFLL